MKTANIIPNGLNNGWKKPKLVYKNLSKAIIESKIEEFDVEQPFQKNLLLQLINNTCHGA